MFASTYTSWRTGLPLASAPVTVKCQASLPPRASGRTMRPWPSVLAPLTRESFPSRKNIRCSAAASVTLGVVETDVSVYRVPVVEVTFDRRPPPRSARRIRRRRPALRRASAGSGRTTACRPCSCSRPQDPRPEPCTCPDGPSGAPVRPAPECPRGPCRRDAESWRARRAPCRRPRSWPAALAPLPRPVTSATSSRWPRPPPRQPGHGGAVFVVSETREPSPVAQMREIAHLREVWGPMRSVPRWFGTLGGVYKGCSWREHAEA